MIKIPKLYKGVSRIYMNTNVYKDVRRSSKKIPMLSKDVKAVYLDKACFLIEQLVKFLGDFELKFFPDLNIKLFTKLQNFGIDQIESICRRQI